MFVTASQFYVFIACVSYGVISGVLLLVSEIFKPAIKVDFLKIFFDVICFVLISIGYVYYSYLLNFPNFRAFMFFGVLFGVFLTNKSFYLMLAKCRKKLYNIYVRKKREKQDARKRI